jgi:hypothetical protein
MRIGPRQQCDVGVPHRFSAGGSGLFEVPRHADITVERRKDLVLSKLGRSAVSVTGRSVFVISHELERAKTGALRPSEIRWFFVRVFLT